MHKCDIIIPVWNQVQATKVCLESLAKYTHGDYRAVLIDNGSASRAREYLREFAAGARDIAVDLIRNDINEGFIKAVNLGIRRSGSPYICVLNNDTVLTEGWLDELISVLEKNPKIGVLNPSSNTLGQKIGSFNAAGEYAKTLRQEKGKFAELYSCVGFCMVFRRQLAAEIGYFDEIFGMGNFEDTDFCMKAKQKGYLACRALGAYVYHMENTSFNLFKRYKKEFTRNKAIFESRWGRPKRILFAAVGNLERFPKMRSEIKELLNNNNWVSAASATPDYFIDFKDASGFRVYNIGKSFTALKMMWIVITKKKRFDVIYTDSGALMSICTMLSLGETVKL